MKLGVCKLPLPVCKQTVSQATRLDCSELKSIRANEILTGFTTLHCWPTFWAFDVMLNTARHPATWIDIIVHVKVIAGTSKATTAEGYILLHEPPATEMRDYGK
jgi:hypothetical protein